MYKIGDEEYSLEDLMEIGEQKYADFLQSGIPKDTAKRLVGDWSFDLYDQQYIPYVIHRTLRNNFIYR